MREALLYIQRVHIEFEAGPPSDDRELLVTCKGGTVSLNEETRDAIFEAVDRVMLLMIDPQVGRSH